MKILLVGNPSAQSGSASEHIRTATRLLEARGASVFFVATEAEGRTPTIVARALRAETPDRIIALGGDGTFNEVASGLIDSGVLTDKPSLSFAFLPMGTANDQARSFGLGVGERGLPTNIEIALSGYVQRIDVGHIEMLCDGAVQKRAHFFDSASFGMGANILGARNRDRKEVAHVPVLRSLYRDQAVYIGAALDNMLRSPLEFSADAHIDGEVRTWPSLNDFLIKATPVYAGAWVFDRSARVDDGLFEMMPVVNRGSWLSEALASHVLVPGAIQKAISGRESGELERISEVRLCFRAERLVPSQIDGEEWIAGNEFRIRVEARALPLCVPENPRDSWLPGLRRG